jgi:hypothetical protein
MKVIFDDKNNDRGIVESVDGEFKFKYSGEFDSVYSAVCTQNKDLDYHGVEDPVEDAKVDELIDLTATEKVRKIYQKLMRNKKVVIMDVERDD